MCEGAEMALGVKRVEAVLAFTLVESLGPEARCRFCAVSRRPQRAG